MYREVAFKQQSIGRKETTLLSLESTDILKYMERDTTTKAQRIHRWGGGY